MAIRKVARLGHPVLRRPSRDLTREEILSSEIQRLVGDMRETMAEYAGVGLAAPQVHEPVRLALVELEVGEPDAPCSASYTIFNPQTTILDAAVLGSWEGCLSVPDLRGYVERPSRIRVDYLDERAEARSIEIEGFAATVFQHETDHLDGVLYVDKIADPARFAFLQEYSRYHL